MRRPHVIMKELRRILLAVMMLGVLAAGVFAEDQDRGQKLPPKVNPPKVKVKDKEKPPPDNGQRGGKRGDENRRGRP
jgi:hypothetical protein